VVGATTREDRRAAHKSRMGVARGNALSRDALTLSPSDRGPDERTYFVIRERMSGGPTDRPPVEGCL
jgi:hypothetical protein